MIPTGVGLSDEGHRFISFDSRYAPLGQIPDRLRENPLVILDERGFRIARPLGAPISGGWAERLLDFEILSDGNARCQGEFLYHLDLAERLRTVIQDPTARQRLIASSIGSAIRGFETGEADFHREAELNRPLGLRLAGTVPRLLQPAGNAFELDAVVIKSGLSGLAVEPRRETPMEFTRPAIYNPARFSFTLPLASTGTRYRFTRIPEDRLLISRFGYFSLDFRIEGRTLYVTRSAYIPAQWIDPVDYPEFLEFCRSADAAESKRVGVERE